MAVDASVEPVPPSKAAPIDKADTTVKVAKSTRDRLAQLAGEHGTNIGALVATLAAHTPTAAEIAAERERTRMVLAERFGVQLGSADLAEGQRLWSALDSGDDGALDQPGE
jgi:hypothetical protein